jgi:superfamily II DNA or RNA helicase
MSFFQTNHQLIRYPISEGDALGLRNSQLGAIHSITSHFTVSKKPAIVVMPTGTGKTAVLMMSAFTLRANRVLVITPSKLVRNQIAKGFKELHPLKQLGVIDVDPGALKVKEQKTEIRDPNDWTSLLEFDIVVSTPNCLSPRIEGIVPSSADFFDLILIDEAHHSPAKSWTDILLHYPAAKKILFTATPFRRDKKEIAGKVIYNYPISQAYHEGIFGKIEFIPVETDLGNDVAIAKKCEEVFQAEPLEIVHYIMVRTDSKKRAKELEGIYQNNTSLRLKLIHSGLTAKTVENALSDLTKGNIDGIICVDMLGEGFDFPNLKIAAIHSPHKSLAATLQFIGRFTRTNAENISHAKFLAIPEEIAIEKYHLYRSNSVWRDMIIEMSESRIEAEISFRELVDGFATNEDDTIEEFEELSLGSIEPYYHVKIYSINDGDFQADRPVDLTKFGYQIVHRSDNIDENISVLIIQNNRKPKWSKVGSLVDISNHLIIVYYDEASSLLFINATIKNSIDLYEVIFKSYCSSVKPELLSNTELNSVLANITDSEFFNIGMRNRSRYGTNESYRIISGQSAHNSIQRSDANIFHRGHLFGKGTEEGSKVTIGLSSSSKVWSNKTSNLQLFIVWSRGIARKINERLDGRTNTPLDFLPSSISLESLPEKDVVFITWDELSFRSFTRVEITTASGVVEMELTDLEIKFNITASDHDNYHIVLSTDYFTLPVVFSYNYELHFTTTDEFLANSIKIFRTDHDEGLSIMNYLNSYPLVFYYSDFSVLFKNNQYLEAPANINPFPSELINDSFDWLGNGVNIENECNGTDSIHDYLKVYLSGLGLPFVYYDHGTGEIADFITGEVTTDEILIKLYHCKGSTAPAPGNRVNDIYEVIGQGIKSLTYTYQIRLIARLQQRQLGKTLSGPCSDNFTILRDLIATNRGMKVGFQIVIVQPGITKSGIEERISLLLSAANTNIRNTNNCKDILIIASN